MYVLNIVIILLSRCCNPLYLISRKERDKTTRKFNYDHRHNVRNLAQLKNDSHVFIDDGYYYENLRGQVFKSTDHPRSYVVLYIL